MPEEKQDHPDKCSETDCWHYRLEGLVICRCCYYGRCRTIPPEERMANAR